MTRHLRPSTRRRLRAEPLESRLLLANDLPFHNQAQPFDVNNDLQVTALDALQIINFMNRFEDTMSLPDRNPGTNFPDVNGSGGVTGHDAHLIVNRLGPNGPPLLAAKLVEDSAPGDTTNVDFITNNFALEFGTTNVDAPQDLLLRWNQQGPFVSAGTISDDNGLTLDELALSTLAGGAIGQGINMIEARLEDPTSIIEFSVTIDKQAPLIAGLHLASQDASGISHNDGITNSEAPALQGLAEVGSLVELTIGDTPFATFLNESTLFSVQLEPLDDDVYIVMASATDIAGNETEANGFSFTIDTVPPIVPQFEVTAIKPSPDQGVNHRRVTLEGQTSAGAVVRLHVDGVTYLNLKNETGDFEFTDIDVELDDDLLTLLAIDAAGNQSVFSDTIPGKQDLGGGLGAEVK